MIPSSSNYVASCYTPICLEKLHASLHDADLIKLKGGLSGDTDVVVNGCTGKSECRDIFTF